MGLSIELNHDECFSFLFSHVILLKEYQYSDLKKKTDVEFSSEISVLRPLSKEIRLTKCLSVSILFYLCFGPKLAKETAKDQCC